MKMLKCLVMPSLLITLLLGLPSTLQSPVDSRQTIYTSSVSELAEFNASETDNIVHVESNNNEAPLLDAVIEDKGIPLLDIVIEDTGIPLLDIVIEDTGIPLLDIMLKDDGSLFSYSANK